MRPTVAGIGEGTGGLNAHLILFIILIDDVLLFFLFVVKKSRLVSYNRSVVGYILGLGLGLAAVSNSR